MTGALEGYAAARWSAVVRSLVLLGAPSGVAQRLAGEATARLLDAPADGFDHATALFGEVVDAWERDRTAWWHEPGVLEPVLEARLDRLDPATRARLVLAAVAELTPEQVDEVVVGGAEAPAGLAAEAARAARSLDPDPPQVGAVAATVRGRRRRRRTAAVVGAALAAGAAAGTAVVLVDPTEPEPSPPRPPSAGYTPPGLPTTDRSVVVRNDGDPPVPWYDGRLVHLDGERVDVASLRSMARVSDGVAGVLADGTVVAVGADGAEVLGRTRRGAEVAASPGSPGVAWIDLSGDLVVARVPAGPLVSDVPDGARLALRDGTDTYLALGSGHLVVDDRTRQRAFAEPAPLAVAGRTRLVAASSGLRVVSASGSLYVADLTSRGAVLSADGRYLLAGAVTSSSSVPAEVIDVGSGKRVDLPVPDDGRVSAVSFGPDDTVTLALSRPDGARFPATVPRGNGAQPGYDVVTCRLREGTCEVAAQLDNVGRAPLLAR